MNYWIIPGLKFRFTESIPTDERSKRIVSAVCQVFGVSYEDMKHPHRGRLNRCTPRQVCMYLMKKHTDMSLEDIGEVFKRHHTSVIHNTRAVAEWVKHKDPVLKLVERVEAIM